MLTLEERNDKAEITLVGSGWKPVSMVDVYRSVTFTLWLCGCNLKCPFCHNWRLAEKKQGYCAAMDTGRLLDELSASRLLIDYLHVTGGEPLVQYKELWKLFSLVKENMGIPVSLNTNFTLHWPLREMINSGLIDHLATDLKIPPTLLYGYPEETSLILWKLFLESLSLVADHGIMLELRVPVMKDVDPGLFEKYAREAVGRLRGYDNYYVIVQPLLGPPVTEPRSTEWCRLHCDPSVEKLEEVASILGRLTGKDIIVRKTLTLG